MKFGGKDTFAIKKKKLKCELWLSHKGLSYK